MFLPEGITTIAQAYLFSGIFSLKKTLFHSSTMQIYLLGDNVKIINKLRGTSLMFARFMDTHMAGITQKPW